MTASRLKNAAVLSIAVLLASLGIYNIFLKATWTLMDDGVFWKQGEAGLYAARIAAGGPGRRRGRAHRRRAARHRGRGAASAADDPGPPGADGRPASG